MQREFFVYQLNLNESKNPQFPDQLRITFSPESMLYSHLRNIRLTNELYTFQSELYIVQCEFRVFPNKSRQELISDLGKIIWDKIKKNDRITSIFERDTKKAPEQKDKSSKMIISSSDIEQLIELHEEIFPLFIGFANKYLTDSEKER